MNNQIEQFILPYINSTFFNNLSNRASKLEESWFYVLYKIANPDSKESKAEVIKLNPDWKQKLLYYLSYNEVDPSIQNATNIGDINKFLLESTSTFYEEKGTELLMDKIHEMVAKSFGEKGKKSNTLNKFLKGWENELLIAGKRYLWGKNFDPDITYQETEGQNIRMQMRGDIIMGIPNKYFKSKINIPFEAKTSLEKFHVTGSKANYGNIIGSMIQSATVRYVNSNTVKLQLKKSDFYEIATILANRKFLSPVNGIAVYEDGRSIVLPDEMFKRFSSKGLTLWYEGKEGLGEVVQITNTDDIKREEDKIKESFRKKIAASSIRYNLWYGRQIPKK